MTTVAAVIVTWNRRDLLRRCLGAVLAQRRAPDLIVLIDNASTDGTPEMLAAEGFLADPRLRVFRMTENLGGAGGFAEGIRRGRALGADWLWLFDDDTLPEPGCLAELLRVAERPWRRPPALLASRVVWTDGTLHPMNRVKPLRGHRPRTGPFPIRACSFVSCLVRGTVVDAVGLPVAAYRLWLDDVEYTHRLARHHPGICVPSSLAVHATAAAASVFQAPPDRLRLMVRNWIWMLRQSPGFSGGERIGQAVRLGYTLVRRFARGAGPAHLRAVVGGIRSAACKP
jgi:rhamnopyranosyl-N-acetylglucosaminyl-diphospho-decaprenol beta-1,3/1,4-galactofuranosyltransferase